LSKCRILFSIAVNQNWILYQSDVENIFPQGISEEEVYMTIPPGYKEEENTNLICRLKKSIYGLKNLQEFGMKN
jgi:Reverse transcriptase (RNA-dependent DNA polymerase)